MNQENENELITQLKKISREFDSYIFDKLSNFFQCFVWPVES